MDMSEQELEALLEKTVRRTLVSIGIDVDHPVEMQRDFNFVREWRSSVKAIRRNSILTAIGVVVTGSLGLLWLGINSFLSKGQ